MWVGFELVTRGPKEKKTEPCGNKFLVTSLGLKCDRRTDGQILACRRGETRETDEGTIRLRKKRRDGRRDGLTAYRAKKMTNGRTNGRTERFRVLEVKKKSSTFSDSELFCEFDENSKFNIKFTSI